MSTIPHPIPNPNPNPAPRLTLRNLHFSQKALVFVILLTVGGGYLAALANLFATHAPADSKQSIRLEEFLSVLQNEGIGSFVKKATESLGMDDVVKHFHGTPNLTHLEGALNGSMRDIIRDEMCAGMENPESEEDKKNLAFMEAMSESTRQSLIAWSHLESEARQFAYEKGMPVKVEADLTEATMYEVGGADFAKFNELWATGKDKLEEVELDTVIKSTFDTYCASCHGPGGEMESAPLTSYVEVNKYTGVDRGISVDRLALHTHVHLLGFSVLFAMTGFLFSLTSWPSWVRSVFTPWTLGFQLIEIACWWLAKTHIFFAMAIFALGPVIGIGLAVQILGSLLDLLFRRPTAALN